MKQIKYIFILFAFFSIAKLSISQQDKVSINKIGFLGVNNQYAFDGAMGKLDLIIDKCKVRDNKIKLKGQLIDRDTKGEICFYIVYIAENNIEQSTLNIKDTLILSEYNILNPKFSNRFSISTKLKANEGIYFQTVGYGMVEVIIKDQPQ